MNVRIDVPVLLHVRCSRRSDGLRERLLTALIARYDVVSAYEFDDHDGMCLQVSFGERAWPGQSHWAYPELGFEDVLVPLDVDWRRYPELKPLITALI